MDILLKIKCKWQHARLHTKIVSTSIMITILFYISSCFFIYTLFNQNTIKSSMEHLETLNKQYSINLENSYFELSYQILHCLNNNEILQFIEEEHTEYNKTQVLKKTFGSNVTLNKYLNYVVVCKDDGQVAFWNNRYDVNEKIYSKYIDEAQKYFDENISAFDIKGYNDSREGELLIYNKLHNNYSLKKEGIVICNFSSIYFSDALQLPLNSEDNIVIVKDKNANIILNTNNSIQIEDIDKQNYFIVHSFIDTNGWEIITLKSKSKWHQQNMQILIILSALSLVVTIISFWLFKIITNKIIMGLKKLNDGMELLEQGNYHLRIKPVSYDEIGLMSLRFNYMAQRMSDLLNQVILKEREKRQKEFEVLQAQMNPHFLYNSLGTIKWQANLEEKSEIEKYIDSLISLLRLSVRAATTYIKVEDEIEYTKNYIELQRYSSGESFEIEYQLDKECYKFYTVKFILQPLIENAIFHAFDTNIINPTIRLSVSKSDEELLFEIEDNGIGMSSEKIDTVLNGIEIRKSHKGLNSVAISNINQRIKIHYGQSYGIKIESELGSGTKIKIMIPLTDRVDEDDEEIINS